MNNVLVINSNQTKVIIQDFNKDASSKEYNLEDEANEVRAAGIIGTCAVKNTLGDKNE